MLPKSVWSAPKLGTINLHASILPNYRGAAPIQHAIIQGETKTGVSTFFLKHEIDTGDLIDQKEVNMDAFETGGTLHDKLMVVGSELMIQSLKKIEKQGNSVETFPQVYNGTVKTAPKLNRDFCKIEPTEGVNFNFNKIRGLSPYPGAWINSVWGEMKIFESEIAQENPNYVDHSTVFIANKKLYIKCIDGFIEVKSLQLQGKSRMDAKSFLNGLK